MWLFVALLCLVPTACNQKAEPSGYNPFIDSFVSGQVSKTSDIVVVFTTDVDEKTLAKVDPADVMTISPSVSGRCRFSDGHTLVFTPDKGFDHATEYTVTVSVGDLFPDVEAQCREFVFTVVTRPLVFMAETSSFAETTENHYAISFAVTSSDVEDSARVEKSVSASHGSVSWSHHADMCHHVLNVNVEAANERQELVLKANDDAGDGRVIATFTVPSKNEMIVVESRLRHDFQTFIEVTFSKKLDENQDLTGLAYINGCKNRQVDVSGNTIRLYPDLNTQGRVTVMLSGAIRSASGATLGSEQQIPVNVSVLKPKVEFASKGVIVPLDGQVTVPFSAVYLRGVRVKVIKIFANNVGAILQEGGLDLSYGLTRYGRPVAVKTLILDEQGADLSNWRTYSLDLTDLFKAEPGAMYRVDLIPVPGLTAWPGADELLKSKEEAFADDERIFKKMCEQFDSGNGWYDADDISWEVINWNETDDPTKISYYRGIGASRNVLATNIGLSAFMGDDNQTTVVALDLPSAQPISGAEITVYNYQNQPIASATTDSEGKAIFAPDALKGRPFYVKAVQGQDNSFLRLNKGENLSTSSFDVAGEQTQAGGLKGFIYGERGVWRPGDTLNLGFMLRDADSKLPKGHPVTLEVRNPVGQLVSRQIRSDAPMGLYAFKVPTDVQAPTGSWSAKVTVGGAVFEKRLRVETIKPNRLKINLGIPDVIPSVGCSMPLHVEWLNGASVGGLRYATTVTMVKSTTAFKGWDGYVFDDASREFESVEQTVATAQTDAEGNANVAFSPKFGSPAPGLLRAAFTTRVYEPSGEFSLDSRLAAVSPYGCYVGIKNPQQDRKRLTTGENHTLTVAVVNSDGKPVTFHGVNVEVYKVENYWWWSATNDVANFRSSNYRKPVKTFNLSSNEKGVATFSLNFPNDEWGTYLIFAKDASASNGHSASLLSYFDWPDVSDRFSQGGSEATSLAVSSDKEEYNVGERMRLSFPSAPGAKAVVSLCRGGSVLSTQIANCASSQTSVDVEVTPEMMPNVYAYVSLVQPYAQSANDAPLRLYGVAQASVTSKDSHLEPKVVAKDEFEPLSQASVTVSETSGRPMAYTLAIVDEGLLDLTHFKTPDAWSSFFAREALGVGLWDFYNIVSGAYGGRIEQLFSIGGDEDLLGKGPKAFVNRFTPMVRFYGPFQIGKGDKKTHKVDVPNYAGRVRVMVVATDGAAYGSAEKSVRVTKPLLVYATMPRQIGVNDRSRLSATVLASKAVGSVDVTLTVSDGLKVFGETKKTVSFDAEGDKTVSFDVEAGSVPANATVSFRASCSADKAEYTTNLAVRYVGQLLTTTSDAAIQPGKEWAASAKAVQGVPESAIVELSSVKPLNVASRVATLLAYPHGCAEQTTSKALAQLYLSDFTALTPEQQKEIEANVNSAIKRLYSFATPSGGFAYWPDSPNANLWASAYAYVFFSEAESRGFFVQSSVKKALAQYLSSNVGRMKKDSKASWASDDALALYALALDKKANMAAMNRSREVLASLKSPNAEASDLLAAAYALAGHNAEAQKILSAAGGANLAIRLIAQTATSDSRAAQTAETLRQELVSNSWMSTYQVGTALMAWSRFAKKFPSAQEIKASVSAGGKNVAKVETQKSAWNGNLNPADVKSLKVKNNGQGVVYVSLAQTSQVGQQSVSPSDNGLAVDVQMSSANGSAISSSSPALKAGDTYFVTIAVRNTVGRELTNIAVSHVLPAGVEVLKVESGNNCSNVDVRDDRILFYADELPVGQTVTLRATLSATYAGHYYKPATTAEAMYDNKIGGCDASGEMTID